MEKRLRKYRIGGLFLILALFLWGCSPGNPGDQLDSVPYSLYGTDGDWEIRCTVREMTGEEKEKLWADLEKDLEEILSSKEMADGNAEEIKEQYERIKQELAEETVYISTVSGVCRKEEWNGQSFDYRLTVPRYEKLLSGTQTVSSGETRMWYQSWQTESQTKAGLFIPPAENAAMVIRVEDQEEITVPLALQSDTQA